VNYSVSPKTKRAFDRTFRGRNKSAVIARLMEEAVEAEKRAERRRQAVERLLRLREKVRPVPAAAVRRARRAGRE
jgi:hypothetical protein